MVNVPSVPEFPEFLSPSFPEFPEFPHSDRFAGLAATDCFLFGSEEALDDLRQHRLDG